MGLQLHPPFYSFRLLGYCSKSLGTVKADGHLTSLCARRTEVRLQRGVGLGRFLSKSELDVKLAQKATAKGFYRGVCLC